MPKDTFPNLIIRVANDFSIGVLELLPFYGGTHPIWLMVISLGSADSTNDRFAYIVFSTWNMTSRKDKVLRLKE